MTISKRLKKAVVLLAIFLVIYLIPRELLTRRVPVSEDSIQDFFKYEWGPLAQIQAGSQSRSRICTVCSRRFLKNAGNSEDTDENARDDASCINNISSVITTANSILMSILSLTGYGFQPYRHGVGRKFYFD